MMWTARYSVRLTSIVSIVALLLTLPSTVFAQSLRGRISFGTDGAPLVGSIVQARTPDGNVVASVLTSESGIFAFTTLAKGDYSLRVLRIGFRAFDAGKVTVTGDGTTFNITWVGEPTPLTTQLVTAGRTCKISADSGKMIANVWDEARKVLMSSVITESMAAPQLSRITYRRALDSAGRFVRQQQVRSEVSRSFRGYDSWHPDSLAVRGYMVEDESGATYYGPDAATLISNSFAGSHCFFMERGAGAHAGDIGLRFEPATLIRNHVDIRGTFWVEQKTSRLRSVEFLYTGLPDVAEDARSGGFVEFANLGSGRWFVDNWRIRMPRLGVRSRRIGTGVDKVVQSNSMQILTSVEEAGGLVAKAVLEGKTLYERKLPTLSVRVLSKDSAVSVAGAEVRVAGTDFTAVANADGLAEINQLIDGRYTLHIRFQRFAALNLDPFEKSVTIGSTDSRDSVFAPSAAAILRAACPDQSARDNPAIVFGHLRDSVGNPTTGSVSVRFQSNIQQSSSAIANARLAWSDQSRGVLANERGEFKICDVPRRSVVVRAENSAGFDQRLIRLTDDSALVELTLQPRQAKKPTLGAADEALSATTALVEIQAVDPDGRPVPGVRIEVENINGKHSQSTTDELGRVLFLDQPAGRLLIHAVSGANSDMKEQILEVGKNVLSLRVTRKR